MVKKFTKKNVVHIFDDVYVENTKTLRILVEDPTSGLVAYGKLTWDDNKNEEILVDEDTEWHPYDDFKHIIEENEPEKL